MENRKARYIPGKQRPAPPPTAAAIAAVYDFASVSLAIAAPAAGYVVADARVPYMLLKQPLLLLLLLQQQHWIGFGSGCVRRCY